MMTAEVFMTNSALVGLGSVVTVATIKAVGNTTCAALMISIPMIAFSFLNSCVEAMMNV